MLSLPRCHSVLVSFFPKTQFVAIFGALLCLFALSPVWLHAQSATTRLVTGVVTDPSQATVPGAIVTLERKATNTAQTTLSAYAGSYIFPAVEPGEYTAKIV